MGSADVFASFLQGGFEGSCHRRADGRRLDLVAACRHDTLVEEDYTLMRQAGLDTVRDALRWPLIERLPGHYDWSSFLPMIRAARRTGVQVIWDLCHYGVPDGLDIWSSAFVERFAAFTAAAARVVTAESEAPGLYSVMNEISYWAWAGGDQALIYPAARGRGCELKRQLVRAAIAATEAVRAIEGDARFIQPEPIIHVAPGRPQDAAAAEAYRLCQYEAADMLAGRFAPDLGGREELLDIVGVNFYWNNQWFLGGETLGFGHPAYRPFCKMLQEIHHRYRRPLLITETGAEGDNALAWLSYVGGEVRAALEWGVPILGLCLYPAMDYPGWDDERICVCGPIEGVDHWRHRRVRPEIVARLDEEATLFAACLERTEARDLRSKQL